VHLPQSEVYAFGDESNFGDVIAYGLAIVHAYDLIAAERLLSGLKQRYGVGLQEEFHCKIVFSGDQRQKSQWKHPSEIQVLDFAEELILGLVRLPTLFIVGAVHRIEYPEELPAAGNFPAGKMGVNQLTGMMCMAALVNLNEHYSQDQIKFWADPNRTQMPFFGRRMQAHRNYKLTNNDANQHITPEPFNDEDKQALLQAADLFAYTATHALSEKDSRNKERFDGLYRMCSANTSFIVVHNEENIEMTPQPSRLEARHTELIAV